MAIATLVNTFGNGLFLTAAVLFYTRVLHLSPHEVGVGLTLAGLVALLVGVPAGHLADLRGAREVLLVLLTGQAAVMCLLPFVHGFPAFLGVMTGYAVLDRAGNAVRQGLIAGVFAADERVRGRAYLRAVTNLGISGGSALAGAAIAVDSRTAYEVLIVADAGTYLLAALAIRALPVRPRRARTDDDSVLTALRDTPFVVVTLLSGLMALQYSLLEVGLPLWVDRYTDAPRWTIAGLYLVNTIACVLFQVRAAQSATDVRSSARVNLRGALFVAASCLVFALSQGRAEGVAIALLVAGAAVHVTGELFQSAGSWGLGFGLAPEHAQGQYQGLYSTGFAASMTVGPLVITSTVIAWGRPGWYLLACVFLVVGLAMLPVSRWAERTRTPVVLQT
jgi:MFS family permease